MRNGEDSRTIRAALRAALARGPRTTNPRWRCSRSRGATTTQVAAARCEKGAVQTARQPLPRPQGPRQQAMDPCLFREITFLLIDGIITSNIEQQVYPSRRVSRVSLEKDHFTGLQDDHIRSSPCFRKEHDRTNEPFYKAS